MALSPFSDDVVPHLPEHEARALTIKVVEQLIALHHRPSSVGVHLDGDGLWFTATLDGKTVTARTGQGNFTYQQIAHELILASIDPGWDRLTIQH